MPDYVQIYRARIADDAVEPLLAVRPAAIAEAQRLCGALLRAELVHLHDDVWLDVLTWRHRDGERELVARAHEFDALHRMHALIAGDSEGALAQFLDMLQRDRTFEDGLARKSLIDAFRVIEDEALISQYRRKMSSLLF